MKWLDGPTQQEAQKCPGCNAAITVTILENAIKDAEQEKQRLQRSGGIFGFFSNSSSSNINQSNIVA